MDAESVGEHEPGIQTAALKLHEPTRIGHWPTLHADDRRSDTARPERPD